MLILAIEPDRRQAARIAALARNSLKAELVVTETAERALAAISRRVPDLILTSLLLSPKDEAILDERLRELDAAGPNVPTLMIPMLAATPKSSRKDGGLLNRLRWSSEEEPSGGCDPSVFAAQITEYLERIASERALAAAGHEEEAPAPPSVDDPPQPRARETREPRKQRQTAAPKAEPTPPAPEPVAEAAEAIDLSSIFAVQKELASAQLPPAAARSGAEEPWQEIPLEDGAGTKAIDVAPRELEAFVERLEAQLGTTDATATAPAVQDLEDAPAAPPATATGAEADPLVAEFSFDSDLWMPLPAGGGAWPPVEGPAIKASTAPDGTAVTPPPAGAVAGQGRAARKVSARSDDEWGHFDPQQCGFTALIARLEEIAD